MNKLDLHADDYGISPNNSTKILELTQKGFLNSFSIIPNMSKYNECMDILKAQWASLPTKPLISVHINLVGGIALSPAFTPYKSWGEIFKASFIPGKKHRKMKNILKEEIKCQIKRVYDDIQSIGITSLRLDSHIHVHMIPIVFDAMLEAVSELQLMDSLEFVRIPKEPILMFFTTKGVRGTFPLINVIKNLVLRILSIKAISKLNRLNISHGMLCGLILSGQMNSSRINILYSKLNKYLLKRNVTMELLAHPGRVLEEEATPEFGPDDKIAFVSPNRDEEYKMFTLFPNTLLPPEHFL